MSKGWAQGGEGKGGRCARCAGEGGGQKLGTTRDINPCASAYCGTQPQHDTYRKADAGEAVEEQPQAERQPEQLQDEGRPWLGQGAARALVGGHANHGDEGVRLHQGRKQAA
jgi:hypothetical protein